MLYFQEDTLRCIMRTFQFRDWQHIQGLDRCRSCQAPSGRPGDIGEAWSGATERKRRINILPEEYILKGATEHWRKTERHFHLNKKGNSLRLMISWYISKSENTFPPQEKWGPLSYLFQYTKVMNQTISFQSRVLFLVSGFHKKKCRNIYFVKDQSICQNPVRWKFLLYVHSP